MKGSLYIKNGNWFIKPNLKKDKNVLFECDSIEELELYKDSLSEFLPDLNNIYFWNNKIVNFSTIKDPFDNGKLYAKVIQDKLKTWGDIFVLHKNLDIPDYENLKDFLEKYFKTPQRIK
jgi:hypothetical protein